MTVMEKTFSDKDSKIMAGMKPAQRVWPQSRKFILTDKASRRLGEIVDSCETAMLANFQFALPPYPVTYIEFHAMEFFFGLKRPTSVDIQDGDGRIGFLYYDNKIEYAVSNSKETKYIWGAFSFLKGIKSDVNEIPTDHTDAQKRMLMTNLMLGSSVKAVENPQWILDEWKIIFNYKKLTHFKRYLTQHLFQTSNGDLRNFLATILVLNQPELLHFDHIPRKPGGAKRRNKPFAAHTVVHINIGEKKQYVKYFGGVMRGPPRRHEVRGHFFHRNCVKYCIHEFPQEATIIEGSGVQQWRCSKCGGTRSWREPHMRGDASLGYVTKDYEVDYQQRR